MRVLVAFGSKRGGTAGLARMVGDAFAAHGVSAEVRDAKGVPSLDGYDAVVVGGALYANRWHRDARAFLRRFRREMAAMPVYLFSSGPLDDSAARGEIPPTRQVAKRMAGIGARGHMTFGGRLDAHATGFPASKMAETKAGDWRDPGHVARWVADVVADLPTAAR